jgi:predicted DNA binding CopG/RHH family protein
MSKRMKTIKEAMQKAKATGKPQMVEAAPQPHEKAEVKVNISIRLDAEILDWLKSKSHDLGLPYQSFVNMILTIAMRQDADPARIFIQDTDEETIKRIEALEHKIG